MVKTGGGEKQVVIWQFEHIERINDWSRWMLRLAGLDVEKEKVFLSLTVIEFYRWYELYLLEYDRRKLEEEERRRRNPRK